MHISRLRLLSLEIYKTFNDLNPSFMKEIFFKLEPLTIHHEIQTILLITAQIKLLSAQTVLGF